MTNLIIDTDVWLDMVENHESAPYFDVLLAMIAKRLIKLVVPETVLEEFRRRREDVSERTTRSLTKQIKAVRDALERINADPATLPVARDHLAKAAQQTHRVGIALKDQLDRIETLLERHEVKNSTAIYHAAAIRHRDGQAPCHNKESFSDAVNLESFIEVTRQTPAGTVCVFVTHNHKDFSQVDGDKRLPHHNLAKLFDGSKARYFVSLPDALRAVDESLVTQMMLRVDPTVGQLLLAYAQTAPYGSSEFYSAKALARSAMGAKLASAITERDLVDYSRQRRKKARASTVNHDLAVLRSALKQAQQTNPNISPALIHAVSPRLRAQGLTASAGQRQIPRLEEVMRVIEGLDAQLKGRYAKIPVGDVARFALASGIEIGVLVSLRWDKLRQSDRSCEVHSKKRGTHRVSFTEEAWAMIQVQRNVVRRDARFPYDEYPFPYNEKTCSQRFTLMKKALGFGDEVCFEGVRHLAERLMQDAGLSRERVRVMTGKVVETTHMRIRTPNRREGGAAA